MSGSVGVTRKVYDQLGSLCSSGQYNGGGSPTTSWSAGVVTDWLTPMLQGAEDNERIGYSVAIESFDIRIKITPDPAAAANGVTDQVRMLIVADNECDGAQPNITEILGDSAQLATTVATGLVPCYLQPAYFGRFKIIDDIYTTWTPPASTTGALAHVQGSLFHDLHHDMKGHKIVWDMTDSNAITNARKGHIFIFFLYERIGTSTGGIPVLSTSTPPTINFSYRMRYIDA
jgi:hypothetical protein